MADRLVWAADHYSRFYENGKKYILNVFLNLQWFIMAHILDDITVSNRAVATVIQIIMLSALQVISNICKQQNRSALGSYLIFIRFKTVRVGFFLWM